jgi:acyl carrier protein
MVILKEEFTIMVFEKVQSLLAEQLNIDDPSTITLESNVIADLHADSLDVVEMLMSLEDEFGISVPDEIANELVTVKAIVEFIESQK